MIDVIMRYKITCAVFTHLFEKRSIKHSIFFLIDRNTANQYRYELFGGIHFKGSQNVCCV